MAIGSFDTGSKSTFVTGVAGTNDNDIVVETEGIGRYDTFMLMSTQGAMDVQVTLDGTNYTSAPVSLADLGSASTNPVLVTVANRLYGFRGAFKGVRVRQNGATAVLNPSMVMQGER